MLNVHLIILMVTLTHSVD